MVFSRACEYGIRAMLYLVSQSEDRPMLVREIANDLKIPFPFLAKITQTLVRQGLLNSQKGPGGGISLARPAKEITLLQVVEVVDGLNLIQECILGVPGCPDETVQCPLHGQWEKVQEGIVNMLSNQSIAQVAEKLKNQKYVLVRFL